MKLRPRDSWNQRAGSCRLGCARKCLPVEKHKNPAVIWGPGGYPWLPIVTLCSTSSWGWPKRQFFSLIFGGKMGLELGKNSPLPHGDYYLSKVRNPWFLSRNRIRQQHRVEPQKRKKLPWFPLDFLPRQKKKGGSTDIQFPRETVLRYQ